MKRKSAWHYIKRYKFHSLLLRNFGYSVLVAALPLLLMICIGYEKFSNEMNDRMMEMNEELLQKSAVVTDNIMQDIMEVLEQLSQEDAVLSLMQTEDPEQIDEETADHVFQLLRQYTQLNRYITSIYIYSNVNQQIADARIICDSKEYDSKGIWYYIYKKVYMDSAYTLINGENSILTCQPVFGDNQQRIGVVVFDIQLQKIKELLESEDISQNGSFFMIDSSGQVMYCNQSDYFAASERIQRSYRDMIGRVKPGDTDILEGESSSFVSVVKSVHQSWKYALITERPAYKEEVDALRDFLVSMMLTGILSSILAAYIITRFTYRPVKKIVEVIENPRLYGKEEVSQESNELLYITGNILSTLNSKQQIDEELKRRMDSLRRTQSMALQFQIEPHFLYNTLDVIKWRAVEDMGMGNPTSKLIAKLAALYRSGLETRNMILTLKEELDFTGLYIDILKARFGEKLQFTLKVDENLYECSVIKMCIQPLVENAVNHGLKPLKYYGNIAILTYQEEGRLYIVVEDDGQGLSDKQIQEMNEKLQTIGDLEAAQVGLRNVNERIKLIYGNEYGVWIGRREADKQKGTRVVMTFPYKQ